MILSPLRRQALRSINLLALVAARQPRVASPPPATLHFRTFHVAQPAQAKKKMPPKKKVVEDKKVILGRPGNNLKVCESIESI